MPIESRELIVPLNKGMDSYSPDISVDSFPLRVIENATIKRGRLVMPKKHALVQSGLGSGAILQFIQSSDPQDLSGSFYALAEQSAFWFDAEEEEFNTTPVFTFGPGDAEGKAVPLAATQWEGAVYATRPGASLVRLESAQMTFVDTVSSAERGALSARYMIISDNHLMLANILEGHTARFFTRLQWSDLYRPELWRIRTDTEADLFDVDVSAIEVTGLSVQRGYTIIYTPQAIWRASYRGLPQIYLFEPVLRGVGNAYHHALAHVGEVDYFISRDNVYVLDGLQPRPIGNEIFPFLRETAVNLDRGAMLRSFVDWENNEVFWQYLRKKGTFVPVREADATWEIVYNMLEQAWSTRDPQEASSYYFPDAPIRAFQTIDSYDQLGDEIEGGTHSEQLMDGEWQYFKLVRRPLIGGLSADTSSGAVYTYGTTYEHANGDAQKGFVETFESFFGSPSAVKETSYLKVMFKGLGDPHLRLQIGTRPDTKHAITWSAELAPTSASATPTEEAFYFRLQGVGKLVRFRILWENTVEDAVMEIYGVVIKYGVPITPDVNR